MQTRIIVYLLKTLAILSLFLILFNFRNISNCQPSKKNNRTTLINISSSDNNASTPITLVTAYFPLPKSKHSKQDYNKWIENFLTKIETPIVIYTVKWTVPRLKLLRKNKPTKFILFNSIWEISVMSGLKSRYHKQLQLDPEIAPHSPELYAIWNSKPWMVSNAIDLNVFYSNYFFWIDIGCFREQNHTFKHWPDLARVKTVLGKRDNSNKIHFFTVNSYKPYWDIHNDMEASSINFVIGGFFGGSAQAILWYSKLFYDIHNKLLAGGHFVGKDQTIINRISIKSNYSERIIVTCSCKDEGYNAKYCGNHWFYFQNWYANDFERGANCSLTNYRTMEAFVK